MESFDEYIRRTMSEQTHEFDEKYWLEAQRLLDEADRKRRRRKALLWWLGGGAGLILLAVLAGWWAAFLMTADDFQVEKTTAGSIAEKAVSIEKNNGLIENRIENRKSGDSTNFENGANFSTENGGTATEKPGKPTAKIDRRAIEKTAHSTAKNGAGQAPKLAHSSASQRAIQQQNATPKAGRGAASTNSESGIQNAEFSNNSDSKIPNPQAEMVLHEVVPPVENHEIQPLLIPHSGFRIPNLEEPSPILHSAFRIPYLNPPVRVILMPFFEWKKEPVLASSTDSTATQKGIREFGLEAGSQFGKPVLAGQMQEYRLGLFVEKQLKRQFFYSFSLDYEQIHGLSGGWPEIEVKTFRFGLEPVKYSTEAFRFHYLTPGAWLHWQFMPQNRLTVGLKSPFLIFAKIHANGLKYSPFGSLVEELPRQTGHFIKLNTALHQWIPQASARYEIRPRKWLNLGVSASYNLWQLNSKADFFNPRKSSPLVFGGHLRVYLK